MKQSGHLNPSEESGTGFPVTSKCRRTRPHKHRGVGRQQQHDDNAFNKQFTNTVKYKNKQTHR